MDSSTSDDDELPHYVDERHRPPPNDNVDAADQPNEDENINAVRHLPPAEDVQIQAEDVQIHQRLSYFFNSLDEVLSQMYWYYFDIYNTRNLPLLQKNEDEEIAFNSGRLIQLQYFTSLSSLQQQRQMSTKLLVLNHDSFKRIIKLATDAGCGDGAAARKTLMSISVAHFVLSNSIQTPDKLPCPSKVGTVNGFAQTGAGVFLSAPLSIDIDLDENDGNLNGPLTVVNVEVQTMQTNNDDRTRNRNAENQQHHQNQQQQQQNQQQQLQGGIILEEDRAGNNNTANSDQANIGNQPEVKVTHKQIECDLSRIRYCCSLGKEGGKEVCSHCWKIAVCHARLVTIIAKDYHNYCAGPPDSFGKNQKKVGNPEFEYNFSGGRGVHIFCRSEIFEAYSAPGRTFRSMLHEMLSGNSLLEFVLNNKLQPVHQLFLDIFEVLSEDFVAIFCTEPSEQQRMINVFEKAPKLRYDKENREFYQHLPGPMRNSIFCNPFLAATLVRHANEAVFELFGALRGANEAVFELMFPKKAPALHPTTITGQRYIESSKGFHERVTEALQLNSETAAIDPGRWKNFFFQRTSGCIYARFFFYVMLKMLHPRLDKNVSASVHSSCALPMVFHKSLTLCYPFVGNTEKEIFDSMSDFGKKFDENQRGLEELKLSSLVIKNNEDATDGWMLSDVAKGILEGYRAHLSWRFQE